MLKDKVVIVTGGAGLLGKEFIKAIVEQKGIAIIADINKQIGKDTEKLIQKELNRKKY